MAKVLPKLILNTQVAYIPGRAVQDNLRMFEFYNSYCKDNNIDAVLISLDAAKAFDSVDHNYMFETLKRYGFSKEFIDMVRVLYNEIKADILVNGYRTTMIRIRRCVKQGDALSCALFIICLDPVLRKIELNKKIKAIEVKTPLSNITIKNKTGGYADDVGAVTKNDKESIDNIFIEYASFSEYSGIRLNETKSEIMILNSNAEQNTRIFEINNERRTFKLTSVRQIKICGVTFSNSRQIAHRLNVEEKINRMEQNLISWLHRGLSIPGKIVIINTFGISQLIYSMQVCEFTKDDLKRIEQMIFKFLWSKNWYGNKAPDRIKRDILKGDYDEGGLKVPDIKVTDEALKLKQFLRAVECAHPIRQIQKFLTENLNYDFVYQQEYSRICALESVVGAAQVAINRITDEMRKVNVETCPTSHVSLIASTDIVEFLTRKKRNLALCYFRRLFALGIESYIQLVRESMFPRGDNIKRLAEFVISEFPREWTAIMLNGNVDEHISLTENFPINGEKAICISKVTVKNLKKVIGRRSTHNLNFPYITKLGINPHININPFKVIRQVNHSTNLRFFKFRLLHGDIYTKERMFKFKMVQEDTCDYCGQRENVKHMLWDCPRLSNIWEKLSVAFKAFDPGGEIHYETIFVGYNPTKPILESIITRTTRSLISRERNGRVITEKIKQEIIEHCICNIYSMRRKKRETTGWERVRDIIKTSL